MSVNPLEIQLTSTWDINNNNNNNNNINTFL